MWARCPWYHLFMRKRMLNRIEFFFETTIFWVVSCTPCTGDRIPIVVPRNHCTISFSLFLVTFFDIFLFFVFFWTHVIYTSGTRVCCHTAAHYTSNVEWSRLLKTRQLGSYSATALHRSPRYYSPTAQPGLEPGSIGWEADALSTEPTGPLLLLLFIY